MIGYLSGIFHSRRDPFLLLNVQGVGYKVHATIDIFTNHKIGESLSLFIHTHVREDVFELYGFADQGSLDLFELFIGISGIGPKTAINIFTLGKKEEILAAIKKADVDFFTGVPRLGTKNAQKIIIELKNKVGVIGELDLGGDSKNEVIQALLSFGFGQQEAKKVLTQIDTTQSIEQQIKTALKYLGK